ncbi:MAG: hypothetical protein AAF497_11800 [Planctomycetota bacterium]
MSRMLTCFLLVGGLLSTTGCIGGGPAAIQAPKFDPEAIGKAAIAQYDSNGDGAISDDELEKAQSIKSALKGVDGNQDKRVTAEEITQFVSGWQDGGVSLINLTCQVSMSGKPLEGATVTYEPEEFMGGAVTPATGVTDIDGLAGLKCEYAAQNGFPNGLSLGFYKVCVSKQDGGKESVPSKYNTATTLGRVVTANDRINNLEFKLKR